MLAVLNALSNNKKGHVESVDLILIVLGNKVERIFKNINKIIVGIFLFYQKYSQYNYFMFAVLLELKGLFRMLKVFFINHLKMVSSAI